MFYLEQMRERTAHSLKLRFASATLIAICVVATAGPQRSARPQSRINRPRLVELNNVEQLKEAFERDSGNVRLVVLVSPT